MPNVDKGQKKSSPSLIFYSECLIFYNHEFFKIIEEYIGTWNYGIWRTKEFTLDLSKNGLTFQQERLHGTGTLTYHQHTHKYEGMVQQDDESGMGRSMVYFFNLKSYFFSSVKMEKF